MIRKALKGAVAVGAGLALGLGSAGIAVAQGDDEPVASGTISTQSGVGLNGSIGENSKNVNANIINLNIGDDAYLVYCIQINEPLQRGNVYEERPWAEIPVEDLPRVLGILVNGYNGENAVELLEAAEVDPAADFAPYTVDQIAYGGTQGAIWHTTDGWDINASDPAVGGEAVDAAILKIYEYLINEIEPIDEPDFTPEFSIDDSAAVAEEQVIGPYQVSTNIGPVTFDQPEGATIVDENGDPIDAFVDGGVFYVVFDEPGSAKVELTANSAIWQTPVGRTFVPTETTDSEFSTMSDEDKGEPGNEIEGQRLILAQQISNQVPVEMEFEIIVEEVPPSETTPVPPPAEPKLPVTGTSIPVFVGAGAALLLAGGAALVLMRRRAATAGADWGDDTAK